MYWSLPYCFIFVPFKLSFYSLHCHDISSVGLVVFHKCLCIDLFFISCCHLFSKHDPCTNYLFLIAFTGESTAGCAANFVFALWMQILEDFITETLCYLSSGIFVAWFAVKFDFCSMTSKSRIPLMCCSHYFLLQDVLG